MNITSKWIIGCIGALMVIFGLFIILSGLKLLRIRRNKAVITNIKLVNEKNNHVLSLLRKGELELLSFKPGQLSHSKLGSDDSLHSAKNSVSRGELDNSLESKINGLENKLEIQTNKFWSEFPNKIKFKKTKDRLVFENKRLERAKLISNLQSEIINLKKEAIHDRTSITSGTNSLRGDTLDTLGYNMVTSDRGSFGSDYSFYSARTSFSRRVSANELKLEKPVEVGNMDSDFYIKNNNKLEDVTYNIRLEKGNLNYARKEFRTDYIYNKKNNFSNKKERTNYEEEKYNREKEIFNIETKISGMEKEVSALERILIEHVLGPNIVNNLKN